MNKKKARHQKHKRQKFVEKRETRNSEKTLTGQPSPLSVEFSELRRRALSRPVLNGFADMRKSSGQYHTKVIDFSNIFYLFVSVLVILRDGQFFWYVEASLISKANRQAVKIALLTTSTIEQLKIVNAEALDDAGDRSETVMTQRERSLLWETPFTKADYENLFPRFRKLINEVFG